MYLRNVKRLNQIYLNHKLEITYSLNIGKMQAKIEQKRR